MSLTRRDMLARCANGFGALAFSALLAEQAHGRAASGDSFPHFRPRAKNVIFLFMDGGVSQVDSFDPKPRLQQENGKAFKMKIEATQFDDNGAVLASPWKFKNYGQSGIPVSALFPHIASLADELCVIRSMKADFPEHSQACYFLHSGHPLQGRPSMGAWISYGLGSENKKLPGFVVINGGCLPLGGVENYSNGFLPAIHQGSLFDAHSGGEVLRNITPADGDRQRNKLRLITEADRDFAQTVGPGGAAAIESAIRNYETAFAMQAAVPELTNLSGETEATKRLYGLDSTDKFKAQYARQCLLARRLVERGVRFVELTCVKGLRFVAPWDQHDNLKKGHEQNAFVVDQPIAALLKDLKARGLLDETIVLWAGEFGRTPFAQGKNGRDHNPQGFSIWLAGGGIKGGTIYGGTDEYGYHAVDHPLTIHDLHATILHLLGLDHEKLTYHYGGRDHRLTDVYGKVVQDVLV